MKSETTSNKLAYSIKEACDALSVGRTHLYKLISRGEIAARKMGTRTVILTDDLKAYLAALPSV